MTVFYEAPPILTKRERQVLGHLLDGLSRDDMAKVLRISPETVKVHTRNLLAKFGAVNLRDGVRQMTAYQSMYGMGEGSENRFVTNNILHVRVSPDRPSFHYHHKLTYLVVVGEYTGHRATFNAHGIVDQVEFKGVSIDRIEHAGLYTNYFVTCASPVRQGCTVDIEMQSKYHIAFNGDLGSDFHRNSIPTASKTLVYEFPPDRIPQKISCGLSLGGVPIDCRAISTTQDRNKFTFHIEPVKLNSLFEVNWQW